MPFCRLTDTNATEAGTLDVLSVRHVTAAVLSLIRLALIAAKTRETEKVRRKSLVVTMALATASWAAGHSAAMPGDHNQKVQSIGACSEYGNWIDARTGEDVSRAKLFADLIQRPIVLLGETHDNPEHHHWQLHTLAALHSRSVKLVIGFEMFPRNMQSVLNQWVNGDLTAKAFLKAVNWRKVWGFDPALYMPLFNFARMHRIPMVALNVDRGLVSRVSAEGWNAVPEDEREGLSDPAPASPSYQRILAEVYRNKRALNTHGKEHGGPATAQIRTANGDETISNIMRQPGFKRFVAAQLTWDRAMAEGLSAAKREHSGAVIVGVMGSGHLSNFHGVPHQLGDLGVADSAVLIPVEANQACDKLGADYADAIFTVKSSAHSDRPRLRLGVLVRDGKAAALIDGVIPDSVADAAKLRKGDRIIRAAGVDIRSSEALMEVISRQAPGTWLPLIVEREGAEVELIAKFPATREKES